MSDIIVDYGSLPDDIREKLAELELELSEGMSSWKSFDCNLIDIVLTLDRSIQ